VAEDRPDRAALNIVGRRTVLDVGSARRRRALQVEAVDTQVGILATQGRYWAQRPASSVMAGRPGGPGLASLPQERPAMTLAPVAVATDVVRLPAPVHRRLVSTATAVHHAGLKSFGLLVASPEHPDFPYTASDVFFFDPLRNRRNEPANRAAFEAQGTYFRSYDDAGFVADAKEVLDVFRQVDDAGLEVVAMFHAHRRQPANFSSIDFRLHNPAIPWHLIISLRDPEHPVIRAFAVRKDPAIFGISADDGNEDSEQSYTGPEVTPLDVVAVAPEDDAWTPVFSELAVPVPA
jgi:proteasome lid subunit RPN8/RPN11